MKLAELKSINVNKTRSVAGRVIKNIFSELNKMGETSPSDQRRYLRAILISLEERGDMIINKRFKNEA